MEHIGGGDVPGRALRRPAVLRLRAERYTYKKNFPSSSSSVFSNMLVVVKNKKKLKNSTIEGEKICSPSAMPLGYRCALRGPFAYVQA